MIIQHRHHVLLLDAVALLLLAMGVLPRTQRRLLSRSHPLLSQ